VDRGARRDWKWRKDKPSKESVMTVFHKLSRVAISAVIALFALVPIGMAETIDDANAVTVPNARTISYRLAAGAVTAPIGIPGNIPVQLIGVQTTAGFRGVGQASLLSIPGAGGFIEWVGLDSTAGAAITQGFSGALGTKIVFIDFSHQVIVEVASPTSIRVRNASAGQRTGRITLIW
jgi:hypothetical protein